MASYDLHVNGVARTVDSFDPDKPPATQWPGQADFWHRLLAVGGPHIPDTAATNPNIINYRGGPRPVDAGADGEQTAINNQLEQFEGVPVISFGWVALFILLYILVVGPLDYLFLKKVVKRLELTWITFPTVVLAVSIVLAIVLAVVVVVVVVVMIAIIIMLVRHPYVLPECPAFCGVTLPIVIQRKATTRTSWTQNAPRSCGTT